MEFENHINDFNKPSTESNTCILNSGRGDLKFNGNLLISGNFTGKLVVTGLLTVGREATVSGEIMTREMVVEGRLLGNSNISDKAVFMPESFFSGSLKATVAEFHRGSVFSGNREIGTIFQKDKIKDIRNKKNNLTDSISVSIPDEKTHSI